MVKASEILTYSGLAFGGYLVFKNWDSIKTIAGGVTDLTSSVLKGGAVLVGGTNEILKESGDALANALKKDTKTPTEQVTDIIGQRTAVLKSLGWTTPEEIAKGINLDYDKRGIRKVVSVVTEDKTKVLKNDEPQKGNYGSYSDIKPATSNKIADTLKGSTKVTITTTLPKTDNLSGSNKGKGTYIVKKADGSNSTRYIQ